METTTEGFNLMDQLRKTSDPELNDSNALDYTVDRTDFSNNRTNVANTNENTPFNYDRVLNPEWNGFGPTKKISFIKKRMNLDTQGINEENEKKDNGQQDQLNEETKEYNMESRNSFYFKDGSRPNVVNHFAVNASGYHSRQPTIGEKSIRESLIAQHALDNDSNKNQNEVGSFNSFPGFGNSLIEVSIPSPNAFQNKKMMSSNSLVISATNFTGINTFKSPKSRNELPINPDMLLNLNKRHEKKASVVSKSISQNSDQEFVQHKNDFYTKEGLGLHRNKTHQRIVSNLSINFCGDSNPEENKFNMDPVSYEGSEENVMEPNSNLVFTNLVNNSGMKLIQTDNTSQQSENKSSKYINIASTSLRKLNMKKRTPINLGGSQGEISLRNSNIFNRQTVKNSISYTERDRSDLRDEYNSESNTKNFGELKAYKTEDSPDKFELPKAQRFGGKINSNGEKIDIMSRCSKTKRDSFSKKGSFCKTATENNSIRTALNNRIRDNKKPMSFQEKPLSFFDKSLKNPKVSLVNSNKKEENSMEMLSKSAFNAPTINDAVLRKTITEARNNINSKLKNILITKQSELDKSKIHLNTSSVMGKESVDITKSMYDTMNYSSPPKKDLHNSFLKTRISHPTNNLNLTNLDHIEEENSSGKQKYPKTVAEFGNRCKVQSMVHNGSEKKIQSRNRNKMEPLDMKNMTRKERMEKLVSFTGKNVIACMDDWAKDNLGLLKIDFYKNYIIDIEGKKFSDKIFSDTVFQLNSKQKKTKTI